MTSSNPNLAEKQTSAAARYGVPVSVVWGDSFGSLRSGTVAVVYDGGFTSLRQAAQWCAARTSDVDACFAVGLNDDWGPLDRGGTGRMYISEL